MSDDLIDHEKLESFANYSDRNSLYDIFENMLRNVIVHRPSEPYQFMIDCLQKTATPSILILGPPSSGHRLLLDKIAKAFDAVFVHAGSILRNAIERQTSVGLQARAYMERGHLVPDEIIISMVLARLGESDVQDRGYVLEGFPRTYEQAMALLKHGYVPKHVIVFDFPDSVIVNRAIGLRYDPVTGRTYHIRHDPPPRNALVESRLTKRSSDSEHATRSRLETYRRNIGRVAGCFTDNIRRFHYEQGVYGMEEQIHNDVFSFLSTRAASNAPRCFKMIIQGLPGSGKTKVAEYIEKRYGHVHVSPRKIILEEVSAGSHWGVNLASYVNSPDSAPEAYMIELVAARLKKKDCAERGWILEGFPNSKAQADSLRDKGVIPNRLIWLNVPVETCVNRLTRRRFDPITGKVVNLEVPGKDFNAKDVSTWVVKPEDLPPVVNDRIEKMKKLKVELELSYGYRTSEDSLGVMQVIDADGLGEANLSGEQPALERVLEIVEGNILRPVPVDVRQIIRPSSGL